MEAIDKKIQDMFELVLKQKKEIQTIEKYSYITNCSFSFDPDGANKRHNLQVVPIDTLVDILGFLIQKRDAFLEAKKMLALDNKYQFEYMGFSFEDWYNDIQSRISKITITEKRKKLQTIEEKLNSLLSPEKKRELELIELEKMLEA
jgi:hypothetical protein